MTGPRRRRPSFRTHRSSFIVRRSSDTICALATPPGTGSIAVIRVSGWDSLRVLDRLFPHRSPSRQPSHTVRLSWAVRPGAGPVDQVMVAVFRAPRSYTGEDMAEISCHGGRVAAGIITDLLVRAGCRPAEPGEFTRRAVLAGKMTLSQAEAVADLAGARTEAAHESALAQYRGTLTSFVRDIMDRLAGLLAEVEYRLGFDESESSRKPRTAHRLAGILTRLDAAIRSGERGRFLIQGASVAITGRPNAGKSSLFNRLLEHERAITSSVPGTTRDRIDATLVLGDVAVQLVDTAGMVTRAGTGLTRLALSQTAKAVTQSDIILAVFDSSRPVGPADRAVLASIQGRQAVRVLNKTDRVPAFDRSLLTVSPCAGAGRSAPWVKHPLVPVSCRTGAGIARLRSLLERRLRAAPGPTPVTNPRHLEALRACRDALVRVPAAPAPEIAALEIRSAIDMLGQVDAAATSTDILDRVFARFCVGK